MGKITITRSIKLLAYLIFIHCLMLVTLWSLVGVSWWLLFTTIIVFISFIYYAQQHQWLQAKKSLVSVEYNVAEGWSLLYLDGSQKSRLSLANCFVTPQLVMLYFNGRYFWQAEVITLIDDAVDVEVFRQLRVYLRTPKIFQQ